MRETVVLTAAVAAIALTGTCGSALQDPQASGWQQAAEFGGPAMAFSAAFTIGARGYIGLGYGNDGRRLSDLWEYDPGADRWTQRASLPAAVRDHSAAFVVGAKAYVIGGMTCRGADCFSLREVWEYEPATDRWSRRADFPEEITTAACFVLNGLGYVGTGYAGPLASLTLSTRLWAYDPQTDAWTRRADIPGSGRYRAVGFSRGGKGYLGTGIQSIGETSAAVLGDMWEYDAAANTWTRKPDFSGPARGAAVSFVVGTRAFVGTGTASARHSLRDFWRTAPAAAPAP